MGMKNIKYTISELEDKTGIKRRTIHFYTRKKMITKPEGLGGGARYSEETLQRLRLIKELQKSHLKLSGIKEALDAMPIDEMRTLGNSVKDKTPVGNKEALDKHLQERLQGIVNSALTPNDVMQDESAQEALNNNFSLLEIGSKKKKVEDVKDLGNSYLKNLRRYRENRLSETTWKRIIIADGIELNIRSDIQNKHGQVILNLIQAFKKYVPKGGR